MFFFFSQRRDLARASTTATHLHIAHVFFFFVHAAHVCACLQVLENPPSCIFNALVCLYMFRPFLSFLYFIVLSLVWVPCILKKKIVVCTAVLITAMCHNLVTCLFHPTLVKKKRRVPFVCWQPIFVGIKECVPKLYVWKSFQPNLSGHFKV